MFFLFNQNFCPSLHLKVPLVEIITPLSFLIKDLDLFGAAYYNGQWKGVRFINN
jgi:hypothetical protein